MSLLLQTLLNGLRIGSIYALVALGYTMVYGIIKLINFAHGDFIMVGGYTLVFTVPAMVKAGMPAWLAVIVAVVVCSMIGITVEVLAYRPIRKKGTNMTALITAIAMSLFLENLAQACFGANPRVIKQTFFGFDGITIKSLGVKMDANTIVTIALGIIVMIGLNVFVKKTKLGHSMRAVSEDKEAAVLTGVNVNKTILVTFAIGSALAAIAALMYCAYNPKITTTMGSDLGLKAFVAAVLGGIGSIPGAMLGGVVIGLVEATVKVSPASAFTNSIVYAILILVLLFKPEGILGKNRGEKV